VTAARAARQIKLGPGGLRDVEFAVQLLQLVHGRADPTLRVGSTLGALHALTAGGYVGRDDAASLDRGLPVPCARWSTASNCTACGAPHGVARRYDELRRLAAPWACAKTRPRN